MKLIFQTLLLRQSSAMETLTILSLFDNKFLLLYELIVTKGKKLDIYPDKQIRSDIYPG